MDQAATGRFRAPVAAWRTCWPRTGISDDQPMRQCGGRSSRALGGARIDAGQLALADVLQAARITTPAPSGAGHPRTLACFQRAAVYRVSAPAILWHSAVLLRVDTLLHHRRHLTVGGGFLA